MLVLSGVLLAAVADAADVKPRPRPTPPLHTAPAPAPQDGVTDLSKAIPAKKLEGMPSTADQYRRLRAQIGQDQPVFDQAKQDSDRLHRETATLQRRLVNTARRVLSLEAESLRLGREIVRLGDEQARLSRRFAADRAQVVRLLAVLERVRHNMPPAMALHPGDALAAARGTKLMGAGLPTLYAKAAVLAKTIAQLRRTRQLMIEKRAAAARNAKQLTLARADMARLLAAKRVEADGAAGRADALGAKLAQASTQATNLEMLLRRTRALRSTPESRGVVVVDAGGAPAVGPLAAPAAGESHRGGIEGVGGATAPGMTYVTLTSAQVVAPADGEVRYAGPYQGYGQALILRIAGGYDAVLVGLGRLDVRLGDHVLAGEPVGRMPGAGGRQQLYFELRYNERGLNPAHLVAGQGKTR